MGDASTACSFEAVTSQVVTMLRVMSEKGEVELQDEKVQYAKCPPIFRSFP